MSLLSWMSVPKVRTFDTPELMDAPDADAGEIERSLRFLARVNLYLGWNRATAHTLRRMLRADVEAGVFANRPAAVLDVATGAGDVPAYLLDGGGIKRLGVRAHVTALDFHHLTVERARKKLSSTAGVSVVCGSALSLPFEDRAFDVAVSSLFLHHLSERDAVVALREMARVSRLGFVVADIRRSRLSMLGVRLLSIPATAMVKHDGVVSVRQSFTPQELQNLAKKAFLPAPVIRCPVPGRMIAAFALQ